MPAGHYIRTPETRAKISAAQKGRLSPNKGRKHSEQSKQNMSFGRIGVRLTLEERILRKKQKTIEWFKRNRVKALEYDQRYLEKRARNNALRRRELRRAGIVKLGSRCVSEKCGWINEDGSRGCTDIRVLQFDHANGGGTQERKTGSFERLCKEVLEDVDGKYQLLCANCNWIKAFEKREFRFVYE